MIDVQNQASLGVARVSGAHTLGNRSILKFGCSPVYVVELGHQEISERRSAVDLGCYGSRCRPGSSRTATSLKCSGGGSPQDALLPRIIGCSWHPPPASPTAAPCGSIPPPCGSTSPSFRPPLRPDATPRPLTSTTGRSCPRTPTSRGPPVCGNRPQFGLPREFRTGKLRFPYAARV